MSMKSVLLGAVGAVALALASAPVLAIDYCSPSYVVSGPGISRRPAGFTMSRRPPRHRRAGCAWARGRSCDWNRTPRD